MKKYGFTLIELIVVITILAILWTISFISFRWYSSDARNSKRINDIANIEKGLWLFKSTKWILPTPDSSHKILDWSDILLEEGVVWDSVLSTIWVSKNAKDPVSEKFYSYSIRWNNKDYWIAAHLEKSSSYNLKTVNAEDLSSREILLKWKKPRFVFDSQNNIITSNLDISNDLPEIYTLILSGEKVIKNAWEKELISLKIDESTDKWLLWYWDLESKIWSNFVDFSWKGNLAIPWWGIESLVVDWVKWKALRFDGINDFLNISGVEYFRGNQARTISFWLKTEKLGAWARFISFWTPSLWKTFNVGSWPNNIIWLMWYENRTNIAATSSLGISNSNDYYPTAWKPIEANKWQLITVTFDWINSLKIYINWELINTAQRTYSTIWSSNFIWKSNHISYEAYTKWAIDEVKIYDYVLSEEKIINEYNKYKK